MKITKSKLKEIIRREIQNLNEGLPWEQELDENWFTDLGAKAKKLYVKANPDSKYAGGGSKEGGEYDEYERQREKERKLKKSGKKEKYPGEHEGLTKAQSVFRQVAQAKKKAGLDSSHRRIKK